MKKMTTLLSLFLFCGLFMLQAQNVQISGTVTSAEDGLTLPGVSVVVSGTTIGTVTDFNGRYSLSVPANAQSLVFSFVGLATETVAIQGRSLIDVSMVPDLFAIDELVIVGYGVQQKRDITGAVSTVRGEALRNVPVQSFDQALQGKAAGVSVTIPTGVLGNPPVIRVRGYNSISGSSDPLIVVDGVAVYSGDVSRNSSASNTLAEINPSDISSIEILKDASATAIYGSRAANGVILITTRRGADSAPRVTFDSYAGYSQPYRLYDLMNAEQFVSHKNLARANAGLADAYFLSYDNDGNLIDTDWSDIVYRTGFQHNHALSISGTTTSTDYFMSVGLSEQEGFIKKNDYSRTNVRMNLDHRLSSVITIGVNASYINSLSSAPNTGSLAGQGFNTAGLGRLAFVTSPAVGPYNLDGSYNIDGSFIGRGPNLQGTGFFNPQVLLDLNSFTSENDRLMGNIYGNFKLLDGLVFRTVFGIDNISTESISFNNPIHGDGFSPVNGSAYNYFDRRNRWTFTNTLNYLRSFNDRYNLNLLAGFEEQYSTFNGWSGGRQGIADQFFTSYQGSFTTPTQPPTLAQTENYFLSYFGRVNFNIDRKYYIEASVRRDGFSGLAAGQKYGTFGGASVMWNLSRETFFHESPLGGLFSDMRLKASMGRVGNISGISNFGSLFLYSAGVYAAEPTLFFSQAGNADLTWEVSNKLDFGLAFGILNDRLQVDLNYYNNEVVDLILDVPQAPSKGVPGNTIPQNIGSMVNKGIEFSLTSFNINTPKFQWNSTFNFASLNNEVTSLAPGVDEIEGRTSGLEVTNRTLVGYPLGMIYGVQTNGVDPATGRRIFIDGNGKEVLYTHPGNWTFRDGTSSPAINVANSGTTLGHAIPKFFGGLDNSFNYGNFDFNIGLTFALDFYIYNGSKAGLRDQRNWNNSTEVYETAWKQPGDITDIPRPVWGDNVSNGSSMVLSQNVERGDYLKVRNLSAGYTFRGGIMSGWGVERLRVYSQVFNAFVITGYEGADPEISSNAGANLSPGVDRNVVPQTRNFTLGVNLVF
jgi:TonB-dependent starch-binding outer membrane protein SusC